MDDYSENESGSTSSGSPSVNKRENAAFYFESSERGRSQPSPLKVSRSVDSSSSEEDEEEGEEADRQTDSPSSSSGESNAERTTEKKSVVTFSTSAPSAVARSVLYGKALRSRGSSSSFGGEGDSPLHESDDAEFSSSHAHKRQASDASGSSPLPPKRMQQVGGSDGGIAGTISGAEYSDFARRMMTKMGYEAGRGLGRVGQGIIEPITESSQRNRGRSWGSSDSGTGLTGKPSVVFQ